jgi:Na+/H+ antiporter NhaA
VVVPATVYLLISSTPETRHGWAVPTATDIAFAVGVLALLGPRVPPALRVLLLALAVIDDLAAILVIAAFYSEGIAWSGLLLASSGVAVIYLLRAAGVRSKPLYVLPGIVVWAGTYAAGIHPTIAGVLLGLLTPYVTLMIIIPLFFATQFHGDFPRAYASYDARALLAVFVVLAVIAIVRADSVSDMLRGLNFTMLLAYGSIAWFFIERRDVFKAEWVPMLAGIGVVIGFGETLVMASDGHGGAPAEFRGFGLSITVKDAAEAKRVFDALADGGQVQAPLSPTFFSPSFGMAVDRFGVMWMVIALPT